MKITTEPRKLALAMLNEMHATMGTELVYKTKFEKLAIDKIAEKHFAVALQAQALDLDIQAGSIEAVQAANSRLSAKIEAQAKQIEEKKTLANAWYDAYEMKRIETEEKAKQIEALQADADWRDVAAGPSIFWETADLIEAQAKQIEALQADAERYRVGREAAFAGLLVDFPHTKTWSDAMDFAYDQMIAARKGNV